MRTFKGLTLLLGATALFAVACNGGKDDTADTSAADTDTDTDADADADADADTDTDTDTDTDAGFTIEGNAVLLAEGTPVAEGSCITIYDPTPVLSGGSPEVLGTGTTDAAGAFSVANIQTSSTVGILMNVDDCDGADDLVYTTNTGILTPEYSGLGDGDVLGGKTAFSISNAFIGGIDASATAAGYGGTVSADGVMVGFVLDNAGAPVAGATVTGGSSSVYYFDADSSDGLFTSSAGLNTATDAAAKSMFAIPGASIGGYSADDGGTHTWNSTVAGSNPGTAVIVALYAN